MKIHDALGTKRDAMEKENDTFLTLLYGSGVLF